MSSIYVGRGKFCLEGKRARVKVAGRGKSGDKKGTGNKRKNKLTDGFEWR